MNDNMHFDFLVSDMPAMVAKEIYANIVGAIGSRGYKVIGGVYPAIDDDPGDEPAEPEYTQKDLDNQAKTEKWNNPDANDERWEDHDED